MEHSELANHHEVRCSGCGETVPSYDTVSLGSSDQGYRELCNRCFNREIARLDGLESFEHPDFAPVRLADCTGEVHEFHFRSRLFGPGLALDAFELRDRHPAGYQFQVIGDPEEDPLRLFGRLIQRIRRALSVKYLTQSELGLEIADRTVRGRIEWDDHRRDRVPILVVDGREVPWDDFGRMLMSFEGWQFRLNILDKSEEC